MSRTPLIYSRENSKNQQSIDKEYQQVDFDHNIDSNAEPSIFADKDTNSRIDPSDVTGHRVLLEEALGESKAPYIRALKKWLCDSITKVEFDQLATLLLPRNKLHLHNNFFCAILLRCHGFQRNTAGNNILKLCLCLIIWILFTAIGTKLTFGSEGTIRRKKPQRIKPSKHIKVESGEYVTSVVPIASLADYSKSLTFDGLLPSTAQLWGRSLLVSWENDLAEPDENVAKSVSLLFCCEYSAVVDTSQILDFALFFFF